MLVNARWGNVSKVRQELTEGNEDEIILPTKVSQPLRGCLGENDVYEPVSDTSSESVSSGTNLHRLGFFERQWPLRIQKTNRISNSP